jgi:hypothetical protein
MRVSEREAAAIYAKAAMKWYGPRARSVALSTIQKLDQKGDSRGVTAWRLVHEHLLALEASRVAHHQQPSLSMHSDAACANI